MALPIDVDEWAQQPIGPHELPVGASTASRHRAKVARLYEEIVKLYLGKDVRIPEGSEHDVFLHRQPGPVKREPRDDEALTRKALNQRHHRERFWAASKEVGDLYDAEVPWREWPVSVKNWLRRHATYTPRPVRAPMPEWEFVDEPALVPEPAPVAQPAPGESVASGSGFRSILDEPYLPYSSPYGHGLWLFM
ncbi:hypothetical protein GHT06_003877 [Daphnia sinensis]|uniref:Uncharacterized protein n=1 Tax=Daphnia sinensis TaxID=1820382 RepID=A0AAD5PK12_9CRUS|nr:hypothetical protein GHT06_003877 [Daphnia sinensis]